MVREILVVPRSTLFKDGDFQGIVPIEKNDFTKIILLNYDYKERNEELENNSNFQQIIPYVWIINPKEKKVFLYKRGMSKGEYKERRYLNNYSGGIGGHIDKDTEEKSNNPINDAMIRELHEEVFIHNYPEPKIVGFINDDSDSLGKVHFGILAIAKTEEEIKLAEKGLKEGRFYTVDETNKILSNKDNKIESWTKLSWPFIRKCLLAK